MQLTPNNLSTLGLFVKLHVLMYWWNLFLLYHMFTIVTWSSSYRSRSSTFIFGTTWCNRGYGDIGGSKRCAIIEVRILIIFPLTVLVSKNRIPYHSIVCVVWKNKRRSRAFTEVAVIQDKGSFAEDNRLMLHARKKEKYLELIIFGRMKEAHY